MKKILILGGAGYIGSHTNLAFLDNNYETIVFDNLSKGHKEIIPQNSKLVVGDMTKIEDLEKLFSEHEIEGVVHFAANPAINEDKPENLDQYYRNNFLGTLNLLQVMNKYGVKNIVFSSTAAVYGNPEALPIVEDQKKEPLNLYGQTKYMGEKVIMDFVKYFGFKAIALRYFNASGADPEGRTGELHEPENHLIPIIIQVALGIREKLIINGNDYNTPDGTCIRDYVHVADLSNAHVISLQKLIDTPEPIFEAINLGTSKGYSNMEIVKMVEKVSGKKINLEFGIRRPGDWDAAYANNSKAKEILNWQPKYGLEDIVTHAYNWHKSQLQ